MPSLSLAYDWSDPLARAVAERLAVNVRDVGITLQPYGENLASRAPNADARIVRLQLPSPDAAVSLQVLAASLGRGDAVHASTSIEELFSADHVLGQEFRLVPLIYVPEAYGLGRRVRNWMQPREGGLPLADVWLETERP